MKNHECEKNDSQISLALKVRNVLADEIQTGVLPPNSKLPGEWKLAERFGTSRNTILEAINMLQSQNLIGRVHRSGTYVLQRHRRFALVFPDNDICFDQKREENWGIVSEIFHGAVQEAVHLDAEAVLLGFKETNDKLELARQMRRLSEFDAALFLVMDQLADLRKAMSKTPIPFTKLPSGNDTTELLAAMDIRGNFHSICKEARAKGYRNVFIIADVAANVNELEKIKLFQECATADGIEHFTVIETGQVTPDFLRTLKSGSDVIYCAVTNFVIELYKIFRENSFVPGQDFGLFAYASGAIFQNLYPALTYMKLRHAQFGATEIRGLNDILNGKKVETVLVKGEFILGNTL